MDLGSYQRDQVTSADYKARYTNVKALLNGRACNQQGTEEAKLAALNKKPVAGWQSEYLATDSFSPLILARLPQHPRSQRRCYS
jgi:hypothetical protein